MTISNQPLWRLAWRRIQKNALQYILLILGVALGVAMMVSIDLANGSAQRAFELSTDAITGHATHRIVAVSPTGIDESLYTRMRREVRVTSAPIVEGYVSAKELGSQPLRLVGVDLFAEPPFRNYFEENQSQAATGGTVFLTQPNTLILSQDLAKQYGIGAGDSITLDLAGKDIRAQVVGLLKPANNITRNALSSILFADIASAQDILGMVNHISYIDLILQNTTEQEAIEAILPEGVKLETAEAQKNAIQQMTAAFKLNLTALSLLALVVGMFLIYNTVTFSVIQRRSLFGILRCLGATPGQLFILILSEATVFSLIGSILGLGLGILLGRGIVGLITQSINDFYFVVNVQSVSINPWSLGKGLAVGIAASIVASVIPAIEAMRTSPQTTLQRSSLESRVRLLLPWLVLAWAAFTLLGIGLLRIGAGGLILAFAGLFAILLATALLTPPVTAFLMETLTSVGNAVFGIVGRLAIRDIVRSLSRTSVAIAALMVAVSVIVGVSIMVGSFRVTVVQWLDQTLQADIYITPPATTANRVLGKLSPDVVAEIKKQEDWEDVVTYNETEITVKEFNRRVKLISADGDVSHGKRPYSWKRDKGVNPWESLEAGEGVIVSEALLLKENISTPPTAITIETPVGWRSFPVLAVFYDYSNDRGTVLLDNDIYIHLWRDDNIASIGLFLKPGEKVEDVVTAIKHHFQGKQDLLVQSNQTLRQGSLEIFDRTFAITDALRLLAVVVAFIGVLSALMSLQLERSRETGILRANGMTPQQLWFMTFIETGLMGATSGILAMPLGYVLAWILIYVINVRSFGWTLQMQLQPGYFLQAFGVAVVAALLAGVYPAWRLGNTVIASAIRQE
ncbi:FtsX-like permease family protein [Scytonema sp. NUACC26]|uniref:FtsX-like permease family protein n=1 Tax=Scytonema sp. NUACC26 TaxID=3140176 RepID=UPI0034DCA353